MLTSDLVFARRRRDHLEVIPLAAAEQRRLYDVAGAYVEAAAEHVGKTREALETAWAQVPHQATDYRRLRGLQKLLLDRCRFETVDREVAAHRREVLFARAAEARRALSDGGWCRASVLAEVAASLNCEVAALESNLFADLKSNHRLVSAPPLSAAGLLDIYVWAQYQAVLLKATRVDITVPQIAPLAARVLFQQLKFRRLLYTVERIENGAYHLGLDGPLSLFRQVTKYGLQLALILPTLRALGTWTLEATVLWGPQRTSLQYVLRGEDPPTKAKPEAALPEVEAFVRRFESLKTPWRVAQADVLLDAPGGEVCIPDLVFTHRENGAVVYLEVLGFWSRPAVWRRIEWVQQGLGHRVIFAVSERLRVSEKALGGDEIGALYVFKGTMSVRRVAERLEKSIG